MTEGLARAKQLAESAASAYAPLKAAVEAEVVHWRWATTSMHSYEPAYFEINKFNKGQPLAAEPTELTSGVHGYGFDTRGRIVVERQQTEFAGRVYETFFRHEAGGIARYYYSYSPKKDWIAVQWLVTGATGIIESHSVFSRGNWFSQMYSYDEHGRVAKRERRGTNPPYSNDLNDWHDIEYDDKGQIVRVYWGQPDGSRVLDFERPDKDRTLRVCKSVLLERLTDSIVQALRDAQIGDDIYAIVFSHAGAWYQHRLPPEVSFGVATQCERFRKQHGVSAPEYIWNPAEWSAGKLSLELPGHIGSLCQSVSQDIWQNALWNEADDFLRDLARTVQNASLPCRRTSTFVAVVVALDRGDFAQQVAAQVDESTAGALSQRRSIID
jgi:hypothetical protein